MNCHTQQIATRIVRAIQVIACRASIFRCCTAILLMSTADGAVLYEQAPQVVTGVPGVYSNSGGQIVSDQFIVPLDSRITAVQWFGTYDGD
jgi:hypothetical protein